MPVKSSFILAAGMLASYTIAADSPQLQEVGVTAYMDKDCGADQSKWFTEQSMVLGAWKSDGKFVNCATHVMRLPNWPQENGKYKTYIDTNQIDAKCQLIFYDVAPIDDHSTNNQCLTPYRTLTKSSGCARVSISPEYSLVYCCGDDCKGALPDVPQKRETQTEDEPATVRTRDVAEIKRAPILRGRGEDCRWKMAGEPVKIKYGRPRKVSAEKKCLPDAQFDCLVGGEVSTSSSVSHSKSQTDTFSINVPLLFGISASYGHTWTTTDETSISNSASQSFQLSISPGSSGYMIFTPKLECSKGVFEGAACDTGLKTEQEWCIPALIRTENGTLSDGISSILQTN